MAGNTKRIAKEYAALSEAPPDGMSVTLADESSLLEWTVRLAGPEGTPFEGGSFAMRVSLGDNYPFKPPQLGFATKIYHPNVSNDERGSMCLGLLRPENWKPSTKLADVLAFAYQLLREPNPDDAVEQSIAAEYRDNNAQWATTARDWTRRYAMPAGATASHAAASK